MPIVVVATSAGCRTFTRHGEGNTELAGLQVSALSPGPDGTCLAIVEEHEIWQRSLLGAWSRVAVTEIAVQSVTAVAGTIFAGGTHAARMLRISADGKVEDLPGFEKVPGRWEWFAGGPPLGVRSLAATVDAKALLAAVHVGGIPRSSDGGESWAPTIPVLFDVHEVRTHPQTADLTVAAAAVGLCVSRDGGLNWTVFSKGIEGMSCLAVAVLQSEVLFSVQDGPFARRSQVWRWRVDGEHIEQVRDGLPEWFEGKVDTGCIAAGQRQAAICDGGGSLWLSMAESADWKLVAVGLPYCSGVAIL